MQLSLFTYAHLAMMSYVCFMHRHVLGYIMFYGLCFMVYACKQLEVVEIRERWQ
jgi:hypothetical protein